MEAREMTASPDLSPADGRVQPDSPLSGEVKRGGAETYRGWSINYDPPPIPVRDCDWNFVHPDYDASWEGEEDGYVSNGLAGYGASVEDCKAQIDDIEEDRA